jgi:predicted nucleic acid-binding protein
MARKRGLTSPQSHVAALQAGCTTVYIEDLQHGQMIEELRIENSFRQTQNP